MTRLPAFHGHVVNTRTHIFKDVFVDVIVLSQRLHHHGSDRLDPELPALLVTGYLSCCCCVNEQ